MTSARHQWAGAMLVALALCAAAPAAAQSGKQPVYWPLVTDGKDYRRVAYPEEAGPLVVLAETEVVIEARFAPVSFWPITREYLPELSGEPEFIPGSIEIVEASGATKVLEPQPYLLWYPEGTSGPSELVHGDSLDRFYNDYVEKARSAAAKLKEFQRVAAEHQRLVEAWLAMAAERAGQNLPPAPPELKLQPPEPYRAYATEPRRAAIVQLPEGTYRVRVRGADGQLVPGSERELLSFAPLGRGVGYVLRPENRWTQPVVSFAPDEAIYTTGETDIFVQPLAVLRYSARNFTRLFRPQSLEAADPNQTIWVPGEVQDLAGPGATLDLNRGGKLIASVPSVGYRVEQIAGAERGYSIGEFKPDPGSSVRPDFTAMRIDKGTSAAELSLLRQPGQPAAEGSSRRLRLIRPPAEPVLFLPALVPLAVGLAVRLARRRTKKVAE